MSTIDKEPVCNSYLYPVVEVWNKTSPNNLIGTFQEGEIINGYFKSDGWDSDNFPYPKKFDLKLTVINYLLLYDNEEGVNLGEWRVSVTMMCKTAQNADFLYPLNPTVSPPVNLMERAIGEKDFKEGKESLDLWVRDIDFEKHFKEAQAKDRFINELLFEIAFYKKENVCRYEHSFFMQERAEP